jgi:hypothetical protein
MSLELVAQVSALVGTSVLLFLVTKPRSDLHVNVSRGGVPSSQKLQGIKRYSSYHRKLSDVSVRRTVTSSSL